MRDVGTPERGQHGDTLELESAPDMGISRVRNITQHPIDRYRARNQISAIQHTAGEQFAENWHNAAKGQRTVGSYAERTQGGEDSGQHPHVAHNSNEVARALEALDHVGAECSGVVIHVCGLGESAGGWARANNRPRYEGLVTLRLALNVLARHFGLVHLRGI